MLAPKKYKITYHATIICMLVTLVAFLPVVDTLHQKVNARFRIFTLRKISCFK